ncbi:MAG TPA: LamG-like jellyroll fold domain-containing protein, partial [Haliangiales bacterium]|nr:LamG-like jellyroll fold domain-containing protein [Haliangiales bacterium]
MKPASLIVVGATVMMSLFPVATANAQILTVTDNLQLWLKADAGVVTNAAGAVTLWADQSPNANHAAPTADASAPLWIPNAQNGEPAVRFDGVDDYLDVVSSPSIAITGDISSFFVVKFDDFTTYRAVWGKTLVNYPAPTDYYVQPGSGIPTVFRGDGSQFQVGGVNGTGHLRSGTYSVVGFEMAGTTLTHYLNGQAAGSGEITAQPGDAGTPLKVGSRDDFGTRMKGEIAELLIYDVALSDNDRDSVINYLKVKYNIINLPPTITLASAPAGPGVNAGDLITLTATAADPDGSIARVDFLANGQPVAAATTNPYSMTA